VRLGLWLGSKDGGEGVRETEECLACSGRMAAAIDLSKDQVLVYIPSISFQTQEDK
jgi:hypothetical protein